MSYSADAVVLVPVKSFNRAKRRLAPALGHSERAALARSMAERVVAAAAPLPTWCVCDDPEVRDWAAGVGALVEWTPGLGLNGAVQAAMDKREAEGELRVIVAHGDLPFATDLTPLAAAPNDEVVAVPDRHGAGTNVISVPCGRGFHFSYGEGSFRRHRYEAVRCGLDWRVVVAERLGWDVDSPEDLIAPAHLGALPIGPDSGISTAERGSR